MGNEIVAKLRDYKKKTGKTISAIAKELNTSEHNVSRWLTGHSVPNHASSLMIEASLPEDF